MASYRIGIDLGTTNCALASIPASDASGRSTVLAIPQQETAHSWAAHTTLPSFLLLPANSQDKRWVAGQWARARAGETPGRVVSSAKSWMVHHAVDRRAQFLPLGTEDIPPDDQLSPVQVLSWLLRTLAEAWNAEHPGAPLGEQDLAITVPASFDPAAQQLTLEAAKDAGFPESTLLLEEPQAAFYSWMENNPDGLSALSIEGRKSHVLVVDIGGGTTDFSLFAIDPALKGGLPGLHRIAVSEHLLLGGDNLDLALAHFLEHRLVPDGQLPATTFAQLVSRCREIKEQSLTSTPDPAQVWPVAVAKPGASLLSGTLRAEIAAPEIQKLLLDGFFPRVGAGERPLKAVVGLREMGLPYAKEAAITRHLADFLRGRDPVDYLLFNGGLTRAPAIREIILEGVTRWQEGHAPVVLENAQPDLAVACGAARYLHLRACGDRSQIEAGASHSYYIATGGENLLCVLPQGAEPESPQLASQKGLKALVGKSATFALLRHNRRPQDKVGTLVPKAELGFTELPSIETVLNPPQGARIPEDPNVRVKLRTTLRSTGLLRVELLCDDPGTSWEHAWPLEFSLRGNFASPQTAPKQSPTALSGAVKQTAAVMAAFLDGSQKNNQKRTANAVLSAAEKTLGTPKFEWHAGIVRTLFDSWMTLAPMRFTSTDCEETWLQVAGYLLRPGCGMAGDPERVATLAKILTETPKPVSAAVKIQRWICARRIAAGLHTEQATAIWAVATKEWREGGAPSAEIALLAGSLESLPVDVRTELARRLAKSIASNPQNAAFWKALGRLLSRVLFHAGADQILAPAIVVEIWEALGNAEVSEAIRPEAAAAWLRAARLTGLRPIDVPKSCRNEIGARLLDWGINRVRCHVLYEVVAVATADQTGLLGESPPPGLSLDVA
jgi:molecular chaperone DnaK (HSP70)